MLAILISTVLSLYIFLSFGSFAERVLKIKFQFTDKFFIGLSVTNAFVSFISLFFPITTLVLIVFLIFCSTLLYFVKENLKVLAFKFIHKGLVLAIAAPVILYALIFSLNPPFAYDSGLYHIQSIKWIEEYAVVPGLANIHGRFGFNPNVFTIFALTSLRDVFNQEIFSVNFTVYSILVLHYINRIYAISKQEGFTNSFLLNIAAFVIILDQIVNLSSPTPDLISIVFPLYILTNLPKTGSTGSDLSLKNYFPSIILSVYTISVKLATLPLFLLVFILIIKFRFEKKKLLLIMSVISFLLLPWLTRNIILSGYLIYPFPAIDLFDFDWKVSIGNVISEKLAITGWARNPGEGYIEASRMNFWEWFPIWWRNRSIFSRLIFFVSFLFPVLALILTIFKKIKINFQTFLILSTSSVGIIFWIFLAPDPRFGKAFLGVAAISPLFYLDFRIKFHWINRLKRPSKVIFIFCLIIILVSLLNHRTYNRLKRFVEENSAFFVRPRKIEIPPNLGFKTINVKDLEVFIPAEGDRCFDHKIPCMPYKNETLTLRGKTLQTGFKNIQNP
ncbi:LIC_10190 family membrane protein [Leptospira alstonii]|uniref:LIC_10190 family membrane protein n=1 Tax=Leptospira alstonii TaxID=28452 RepID=UPI00055B5544|nr:hypothetical protein [Leptospira alstonii]